MGRRAPRIHRPRERASVRALLAEAKELVAENQLLSLHVAHAEAAKFAVGTAASEQPTARAPNRTHRERIV